MLDTSLTSIDISCNHIKDSDAESILHSLQENPKIINFDVRNNLIKDQGLEDSIHELVTKNFLDSQNIPYVKKTYS